MTSAVTQGMGIDQLINMLIAAKAQGATDVRIVQYNKGAVHDYSGIDWVSTQVLDGHAYIVPLQERATLGNDVADSLDL